MHVSSMSAMQRWSLAMSEQEEEVEETCGSIMWGVMKRAVIHVVVDSLESEGSRGFLFVCTTPYCLSFRMGPKEAHYI